MKTNEGTLDSSSGGFSMSEGTSSKDPYSLYGKDILKELKEEGSRLLAWSRELQNSARKSGTTLQVVPKVEKEEKIHRIENKLEPIEDTSYEQKQATPFSLQGTPVDTPCAGEQFYYPLDMHHSDISRTISSLGGGTSSGSSKFGSINTLEESVQNIPNFPPANPQYAHLLAVLQHKYTTLLRKFEEVNEQRMSYIEGIREYQAKLDNARSLLQMHQQEFERVAMRAKELEDVRIELLNQLKEAKDVKETVATIQVDNEEPVKEICEDVHETKEEETGEVEQQSKEKQKELDELYKTLEVFKSDVRAKVQSIENGLQALYMHMLNATEVVKATADETATQAPTIYENIKGAINAAEKIPVEPALERLEDDLKLGFRKQLKEMMNAFAEIGLKEPDCQGCIESEKKIKQIEYERCRLKNMINRTSNRNKDVSQNLKNLIYTEKLKKPIKVQLLKIGLFKNKFVDASIFIKGKMLIIKRKMGIQIKLSDIIGVNFGYDSIGYSKYADMITGFPWNFFTICTKKGYLHFYNPVDSTLELLVAGLNLIAGQSTANNEKDVRIRRTRMKILYHAKLKGMPLHKLWIQAIRKAAAAGAYRMRL
ncbi:hypothetical protein BEWA_026120 [Theileria equi strain WA]|uniref:Uncharacterized protein n=1 Tax=Theileria equi strain WA TaxID=1537102 RepID=L0AWY0_THEEQ|nr:hypothetical protein BEWA_026120 [Theileria equi strain WA]AFZ79763.1 hypothetical protein BEWA_026120 [Theileria equi strain WA]|eukprot:XP_004829429.1 hypothetical protein BEWA_026120 [Theileria equi strain WA]